jgi:hypothetical protein
LIDSLHELERKITAYAMSAPVSDNQLFDLAWSVKARDDLRVIIQDTYLTEVQSLVEEYAQEVAAPTAALFSQYEAFTGLNPQTVVALQRLSFRGFESIALQQLETLAELMYSYTITGQSRAEMIERLRHSINGVYIASDKKEIKRLVKIVEAGSSGAEDAKEKLARVYAADKVGNNMRRYATQMVQDSVMNMHQSLSTQTGIELGATRWIYTGSRKENSRPFCKEMLDAPDKEYTKEDLEKIWSRKWSGKSGSNPFSDRGGYNCTHTIRPVVD